MNNKGLELVLTIIFCDREVKRVGDAYHVEHNRRVVEATQSLKREMKRNGNNLIKASKRVFHSQCVAHSGTCSIHEDFEKEVLKQLRKKEKATTPATSGGGGGDFLDATLERSLYKELNRTIEARNKAAYQLIQQHFARAHAKRLALGEESLDVTERLLCDYESVAQLRISSDPELLFQRVYEWLRTTASVAAAGSCKSCCIKKAIIKCANCKQRCFCSVACQVKDEGNRIFCHANECGLHNGQ